MSFTKDAVRQIFRSRDESDPTTIHKSSMEQRERQQLLLLKDAFDPPRSRLHLFRCSREETTTTTVHSHSHHQYEGRQNCTTTNDDNNNNNRSHDEQPVTSACEYNNNNMKVKHSFVYYPDAVATATATSPSAPVVHHHDLYHSALISTPPVSVVTTNTNIVQQLYHPSSSYETQSSVRGDRTYDVNPCHPFHSQTTNICHHPSQPAVVVQQQITPPCGQQQQQQQPLPIPISMNFVYHIHDNDVLCGRGAPTIRHPGNQYFRELVSQYQSQYIAAKRIDKPNIAMILVDAIFQKGGRFLKRVKERGRGYQGNQFLWILIDPTSAYEKACQALREHAPEIRRQFADEERKKLDHHKESQPNSSSTSSGSLSNNNMIKESIQKTTKVSSSGTNRMKSKSNKSDDKDRKKRNHAPVVSPLKDPSQLYSFQPYQKRRKVDETELIHYNNNHSSLNDSGCYYRTPQHHLYPYSSM